MSGKKRGDQRRRLRVIVTLFTRSASNCLSLRESDGVCAAPARLWIRGSVEETAKRRSGKRRRESGAKRNTRRERYGPPSPVTAGQKGGEGGRKDPRGGCAEARWDAREERAQADDAEGTETAVTRGEKRERGRRGAAAGSPSAREWGWKGLGFNVS